MDESRGLVSSVCAWLRIVNILIAVISSRYGQVNGADSRTLVVRQGPTRHISPSKLDTVMASIPVVLKRSMDLLDISLLAEIKSTSNNLREFGRSNGVPNTFRHVQELLGSTPEAKLISFTSFVQTKALSLMQTEFQLTNEELQEVVNIMPSMTERDIDISSLITDGAATKESSQFSTIPWSPLVCPYPARVSCPHDDFYRTYDGRCNNPLHPLWGAAHQPFVRFLNPQYADGIAAPRVSISGKPLPSARLVSSTVHWDYDRPSAALTLMVMQLGQFIDHDMSRTAISKLTTASISDHGTGPFRPQMKNVDCGRDGCSTEGLENKECLPIQIPVNDTDFAGKKPCLMFVRSMEAPNAECSPGPREQLNQITAFLDASVIYGSSDDEAKSLRHNNPARGKLKVQRHPAGKQYKPLLPPDSSSKTCGDQRRQCFIAGDGRVNEFSGITTQHAIWMREHNRIEEQLSYLNPHWTGERLFQETRKIIIAIWQYIIYKEYLPIILGPQTMDLYRLTLVEDGFWNDYKEHVNPGIANSFAAAAMRFGHSQLEGLLRSRDSNYAVSRTMPLSTLMQPEVMYENPTVGLDGMLRGFVGGSAQTRDPFITKQVTRFLFASDPVHGFGEDLMSLNTQRGRDHGLPGYNYFREWCGLKRATNFGDLIHDLPAEVVYRFELLYETVDDIDLWPAGISETVVHGSLLGPTFTCLLARQFTNLKYGDRFWFENNQHNPSPFTRDQLQSIRRVKYSKLICTNTDSFTAVQPDVLYHPLSVLQQTLRETNEPDGYQHYAHLYANGGDNERIPCEQIPDIDLSPWLEIADPMPVHPMPYDYSTHLHHNSIPTVRRSSRRSSSAKRRRRRKMIRLYVEDGEGKQGTTYYTADEDIQYAETLDGQQSSVGDDFRLPTTQLPPDNELGEMPNNNYSRFRGVELELFRQQH